MFTVENLFASYNGKKLFSDVSFSLEKNSVTALCGLNGSGKSTLLSLMSGIVPPSLKISGKIQLDKENVLAQKPKITAKKISYLVQGEHPAWNISVEDMVDGGRFVHRRWYEESSASDKRIIDEAMNLLSISELRHRKISTLSGGEYQRSRIARSFAQQTDYIFLDEPLSSLDVIYQTNILEILNVLAAKGKTIFISVHDINLASQFCKQMILMKRDRSGIIAGRTDDIINEDFLMQAYGKKFKIFTHPITGKKQIW
ncbi:MAG: ABC transporter ATP-binding protein [Treponema sp.]|nr:ABC transporter ATP-binding protein [Treponema sp.]